MKCVRSRKLFHAHLRDWAMASYSWLYVPAVAAQHYTYLQKRAKPTFSLTVEIWDELAQIYKLLLRVWVGGGARYYGIWWILDCGNVLTGKPGPQTAKFSDALLKLMNFRRSRRASELSIVGARAKEAHSCNTGNCAQDMLIVRSVRPCDQYITQTWFT
jgi:hypothetical protein